ncbi:MAG: valine--tRNA ligase [Chlamydiota bacterium]|nr:valine--tRNA ligase [Chlamydiota bacterium]
MSKKDIEIQSVELPKAYDAKNIESKWYEFWTKNDFFKANPQSNKPAYTISIPPPNVTGALHMGHALGVTLQDILIRWKRMSGFEVLWVPGTDHAGIATQTTVEKHLIEKNGKTRKEFPREEFLKHVWQWKEDHQDRILGQLKRLGASCDWSRLRFTMDEGCNKAVRATFKKMFDSGLIYRGDYLVNWDPVTQTALADDEVEYEDRSSFLWHFKYPLKDGSGHVHIATTRPETMLGDTAVAVSPRDERYQDLVGKTIILPIMNREIPVIKDHMVDPEFGTGMVKITPAHDPNDYQTGLKHNLPFINIMTPEGLINENGGKFAGMSMKDARNAVVEEMDSLGLLEKVEPHLHRVGVSYRSKATIEPYLSKQWFVKMDGFSKTLRAAVEEGRVNLIPKNWENTYYHWIDNLRDWCISRQLWWGHRIPVWYNKSNSEQMICHDGEGAPDEVNKNPDDWYQDDDVLDTWFSSALWPFSILGWPEKTDELHKFYPNSVMITGHDILFFWVARMILMGEYVLDEVPFPDTFLHGLIYGKSYWRESPERGITYVTEKERIEYDLGKATPSDVHFKWEKMSKTKGNVINPIEIIDEYGTDAMRMALCASATQAREIDLDRRRFEDFKNFANKVWNGARFVFMNLEGDNPLTSEEFSRGLNEALLTLEDRWILSMLNKTVKDVNEKLENYLFDQAAMQAYEFFWKEFCSYYVEIVKPVLFGKVGTEEDRKNKQKLLVIVLCQSIRLIHPMAPFISEELFQLLKQRLPALTSSKEQDPYTYDTTEALNCESCMVAKYPIVTRESDLNPQIDNTFDLVGKAIYTIRNVRGEMKLPPGASSDVYIVGKNGDENFKIIQDNMEIIKALIRTNTFEMSHDEPKVGFASTGMVDGLKIIIPMPKELLNQELARLSKEQNRLTYHIERLNKQLTNENFVNKAPAELINKHKDDLKQSEIDLNEISTKLCDLKTNVN